MKEFFNKKARFDYSIEEEVESGVVLNGLEVKAIRLGKLNINGSYVRNLSGELHLIGANISGIGGDPTRSRKLLLHKNEIAKLLSKIDQKGYTLLPLKGYFKKGKFKLLIGLGKGKKIHDKRAALREKELKRNLDRIVKSSTNL